jgi:hypothetical protein
MVAMHTRPERLRRTIVAVAALLAAAEHASAQTALGDGTRLDRNMRLGGGGRNPAGPDIRTQIKLNDAIMTGNAPFGRSFQGNIGYLATEDFRASLGSNSLFAFTRDSAGSEYIRGGIRGTDALQYQFALATGQAPPSLVSGLGGYISRSDAAPPQVAGVGPLRSASDFTTQRSLRPSIVGYRAGQDGRTYAVMASPLLGLQALPILAAPLYEPTAVTSPVGPGEAAAAPGTRPARAGVPAPAPEEELAKRTRPLAGLTGIEAVSPGVTNPLLASRVIDRSAPSLRASAEIPSAVTDRFREALKGEPGAKPEEGARRPEEGQDLPPWEAQLERIRRALEGESPTTKPTEGEPKGAAEEQPPAQKPGAAPPVPRPPSPGAGETGREPGAEAGGRRAGLDPGTLSRLPERVRKLVEPSFWEVDERVLDALGRTKPVIERLAPPEAGPVAADPADRTPLAAEKRLYSTYMSSGEQLLTQEKYFEAEERFVRALAAAPNDPMASVGRVHAQLGAALYLSASLNLRRLISEHPQMTGVRYSRTLLPSGQRCDAIAAFLRESIKSPQSGLGHDAGLLLAYLGYQLRSPATVREGLDAMAAQMPEDDQARLALLGLLERVWAAPETEGAAPSTPAAPDK